jgi:hypothetical protein
MALPMLDEFLFSLCVFPHKHMIVRAQPGELSM